MADGDARPDVAGGGRAFEWWMVANLAYGAGYYAFVILLIPAYVTEVTGNAADAGVVMAIIGLAAVVGPAVGRFADRATWHTGRCSASVSWRCRSRSPRTPCLPSRPRCTRSKRS